MKTLSIYCKHKLFYIVHLVTIVCLPSIVLAIEPIGTIGGLAPLQHTFLNDDLIVRVVSSHIQVIKADTGEIVNQFGELTEYDDVVFSPTGTHCVMQSSSRISNGYTVSIWDVNAGVQIIALELANSFDNAAFSPTQALLAMSLRGEIQMWNWKTGENTGMMTGERRPAESCYYFEDQKGPCKSVQDNTLVFSPDGHFLIVASTRPDIEIWNVETMQLEDHIEGHTGNWVDGVAVSPDGKRVASFDKVADMVYMWDFETRQLLWKEKNGIGSTSEISFSPDNTKLYVASRTNGTRKSGTNPWTGWDDRVRVWDVSTGIQIDTIDTEFRNMQEIDLSPDGKVLLMHFVDGVLQWDLEKNEIKHEWTDFIPHWPHYNIAMSPDGKTLISASRYFIKTWDIASQQMQQHISAEDYTFEGLGFSPDSQSYAISKNPWIELRNSKTGKVEQRFPEYIRDTEQIVFSSSGRWIGAVNYVGGILMLDSENPDRKQQLSMRMGNESTYYKYIGFSDDEDYFVASGANREKNRDIPLITVWKRQGETFVLQYTELEKGFWSEPAFTTTEDGSNVFAGARDGIMIWKILPNKLELLNTLEGYGPVKFSPDGLYLLSNADDHLQIWKWQTGRRVKHSSPVPWFSAISEDCTIVLTYDYTDTYEYKIWDISSLISLLPYGVDAKDRQFVTLGQVKRNQLMQNFPNPFNPETWIPFQLAEESNVTIDIFNPTGEIIRTLSLGKMSAGDYSTHTKAAHWDGKNYDGETVSSGIYFYNIKAGEFSATRKMLIRK